MRRSSLRTAALATILTLAGAAPLVAQRPAGADTAKRADKTTLSLAMPDTLRFTVREGTWISLDVTPDGERIVFELLGDLYRLPIAGGAATRITDGPGYDSQPNVSPDGRWIAFISDRDGSDNLWIARIDGTEPRKLSSEKQNQILSPEWTPDNQYVVATVHGRQTGLRMYHVDGGSGIDLKGPGEGPENRADGAGASMSPDGRWLYFTRRVGSPTASFPGWEVARRDMTTGVVDVVTQAEWGAVRPVVSPDGKSLVYGTRHETETGLRIRNLQTGADRWLIWPIQPDEQEGGGRAPSRDFLPGYAFTPDSRTVVTTFDGKIQAVDVATGSARVIPFEAEVKLAVGPNLESPYRVEQGPVRAKLVQSPRFSPDGQRMVFSVLTKLYTMDVPGGTPRRLTGGDQWEFKPAWSPDGRWIAFVTWTTDGGHVWKVRADGRGEPQRLTSIPAFYTDLTFSPDGSRIVGLRGNAFLRNRTFSEFGGLRIPLDVVWLPADGGEVRMISPANGVGQPHFAADSGRVWIHTEDGLVSMRYDGTDRRAHLKVTGRPNGRSPEPPQADEIIARPDGRWALASSANQLYLVAIPPAGGDAPAVSVGGGGVPVKKITDIGADYFGWSDGGRNVYWAIGSTVYRLPFDSVTIRPDERPSTPPAIRADSAAPADSVGADTPANSAAAADTTKKPLDYHRAAERIDVVLEFPRATPTGSVVLRGATAITMRGDEVIPNADVVVTDNRIAAVGARGSVAIPSGAREIDAAGKFIVPGFVDTHAHWEFRTHDVLEPHNWSLLANLAYGVTSGLDVQTSTNDYFAYQDLVETGQTVGQRAFMVGPGVFSTNDFRSYEETEAFLRRYKEHYRTPNIKSYMVGNRQQRQWVVQASEKLGLIPTTEGGRDMKLDITHAIDGFHGNEHTLPVIPLFEDVVQLYARTLTAYTPTLLVLYGGPGAEEFFYVNENPHDDPKLNRFYPHNWLDELTRRREWVRQDEHRFDEVAAQAAKIQRAGGLVGVGGHGQLQGLGYHWEMWSLAMGGMTPREVLEAATIDGARIIGIQQDLGSLEPGKLADLVVLDRNPLENIRNTNSASWVMKNGELYEAATLTRVWPSRRELPAFWWWGSEPTDRRDR